MGAPPQPRPDWAYFLDMDGTLVDIAERPDAVVTDGPLLALVERLYRACDGALALVSGRTVADIARRFDGLPMPIVGQHGLERRDAAGRVHRSLCVDAGGLRQMRHLLAPLLARHPALLLEDKGMTLALHYRQAPQLAAFLHRLVPLLASRSGDTLDALCVQKGKRVLEIKPCGVDKGTAIAGFLGEPPFVGRRPVYIGDDLTDEYGFAAVNRHRGISIKVGGGKSRARYRLDDIGAVRRWLALAAGGSV